MRTSFKLCVKSHWRAREAPGAVAFIRGLVGQASSSLRMVRSSTHSQHKTPSQLQETNRPHSSDRFFTVTSLLNRGLTHFFSWLHAKTPFAHSATCRESEPARTHLWRCSHRNTSSARGKVLPTQRPQCLRGLAQVLWRSFSGTSPRARFLV